MFGEISGGFRQGIIAIIFNISWTLLAPAIVYYAPYESKLSAALVVMAITLLMYLYDMYHFESASIYTIIGYCFAIYVAGQIDMSIAFGMASPLIVVLLLKLNKRYSNRSS